MSPVLALLFAAVCVAGAACKQESGGDVTPASTAPPNVPEGQVLIKSVAYNPREVRATVGKPVTWNFADGGLDHTVTADDNSFDSGRKSSGTFAHTFNGPGTFNYHCQVHSRMHGTIVVSG